jgi:hypothetical protein
MRRWSNDLKRRAGSFCVLVDGNDDAAAPRDRIAKVGVHEGSIRDNPTILPGPIDKIEHDSTTVVFGVHKGNDGGEGLGKA